MSAATIPGLRLPPEPQFDEDGHVYRDPKTGDQLASVTAILAAAGMKHGWSDEESAKRGTRVHLATLFDDDGDLEEDSVRESEFGYIKAYRGWRERHQFRVIRAELPVMQPVYRYAGKLDRLALMQLNNLVDVPTIAEIKTGTLPWWTRYQLCGYLMCFPDHRKYARVGIELKPDATAAIYGPWLADTIDQDMQVWTACITIYRAWEERKR